jgi:hypothetical protein
LQVSAPFVGSQVQPGGGGRVQKPEQVDTSMVPDGQVQAPPVQTAGKATSVLQLLEQISRLCPPSAHGAPASWHVTMTPSPGEQVQPGGKGPIPQFGQG